MIEKNVEAIIFDFGGVIINLDYNATIDAFKKLGLDNFDHLYSQATQSNLFDSIETGKISPQHFINSLLRLLPKETTPKQVINAWNAMLLDISIERIELLQELSKRYKIYLLSNTNKIHIDAALQTWNRTTNKPIEYIFEKVYFSHEVHMRKPHVEIFNLVTTNEGLNPAKTLFIDDSIQHIQGAITAGLQTHHLRPEESLHELFS
jgi:putative hydrolase of the HAD superfamily